MNAPWSRKKPADILYTIVVCESCSESQTRAYIEGDAVLAKTKCAKCANSAYIEMIYSAPPTHL